MVIGFSFWASYLQRPELSSVLDKVKKPKPNWFNGVQCTSLPFDMVSGNLHLEKDKDRLALLNSKLGSNESAISTVWIWNWTGTTEYRHAQQAWRLHVSSRTVERLCQADPRNCAQVQGDPLHHDLCLGEV